MTTDAYSQSGVNIDAGKEVVDTIKSSISSTHSSEVLTNIGNFASLFDLKQICTNYDHPVLVQSIDGVGTKLIVAEMCQSYRGVGHDIVNHSCNDILVMGAKPLTFLDYIAHEKLDPKVATEMVLGMAEACAVASVSLVGGETAEMPGTYAPGQHDIAGCITGIVEKSKIINGSRIQEGDLILGLASSGLHTNGYSLARKIFFEDQKLSVSSVLPELNTENQDSQKTLGDHLLEPHLNYAPIILPMLESGLDIKGLVHITGGGFTENIPRVLPDNLDAVIQLGSWPVLRIFELMKNYAKVPDSEMYRVFNMGIGMVIIVSPSQLSEVENSLAAHSDMPLYKIGEIVSGSKTVLLN